MGSGKSKRTGGGGARHKIQKRSARNKALVRGADLVFADYCSKRKSVHDGRTGPDGNLGRVKLDEEFPGCGKHYCVACSKYFVDRTALEAHVKSKPHRRTVAKLEGLKRCGMKPHNAEDAERAGGLGRPDNGKRLRDDSGPIPMAV